MKLCMVATEQPQTCHSISGSLTSITSQVSGSTKAFTALTRIGPNPFSHQTSSRRRCPHRQARSRMSRRAERHPDCGGFPERVFKLGQPMSEGGEAVLQMLRSCLQLLLQDCSLSQRLLSLFPIKTHSIFGFILFRQSFDLGLPAELVSRKSALFVPDGKTMSTGDLTLTKSESIIRVFGIRGQQEPFLGFRPDGEGKSMFRKQIWLVKQKLIAKGGLQIHAATQKNDLASFPARPQA